MANWNRNDPAERATANGKPETKRANQALRDYLMMGSGRSLNKLLAMYAQDLNPPTRSHKSMSRWSVIYEWVARADTFDEIQHAKVQAEYDARRKQIMETGLALDHERIEKLKQLHTKLDGYLLDEENVWLRDAKSIRVGSSIEKTGEDKFTVVGEYERIDLIAFNAPLIGKILETIDALAAETGGRVRKTELTGKNGGPIRTSESPVNLAALNNEELEELERLTEKAAGDANINAGRSAG